MAVGVDFLSKTKIGGMKDIMSSSKAGAANANQNTGIANSIFANNKSEKTQKADVANMDSAALLNYVYNNGFDNNKIKLPNHVEFGGQDFSTNGKDFNGVVRTICQETGESKSKVETELKKKYISAGGGAGASLNMNA